MDQMEQVRPVGCKDDNEGLTDIYPCPLFRQCRDRTSLCRAAGDQRRGDNDQPELVEA